MFMKAHYSRLIAIIPLVSFFIFCGYCFTRVYAGGTDKLKAKKSQGDYPCFYQEQFKVDGCLSDWQSKMFYDHIEARVLYAVANDSSRLYFCIQILDQDEQISILHDGLTFTIEANGKKKESCLVKFPFGGVRPYGAPPVAGRGDRPDQPGGDKMQPPPGDRPDPGQPGMNGQVQEKGKPQGKGQPQGMGIVKQKSRRFTANLNLSGFRDDIDGTYSPGSPLKGVETALAYDSTGSLVIEAAIPISYFKQDLRMAKYVSIGFVIRNAVSGKPQEGPGGMDRGSMQGNGRPGGGGSPGGGGVQIEGPGGGQSGIGDGPGGGQGGMRRGPGGGQGGMGGSPGSSGPGGGPYQDSGSQSQSKNYKISHKFSIAK